MMQTQDVISVNNLREHYDSAKTVDSISLAGPAGEIFGMVGPNGSGKTTTIEIIEGLRKPDDEVVRV